MIKGADVERAIASWFPAQRCFAKSIIGGGLSGSLLWRLQMEDASSWVLRRWVPGTSERRLVEIHSVLQRLQQASFPLMPQFLIHPTTRQLWWHDGAAAWSCARWIDGARVAVNQLQGAEVDSISAELSRAAAEFTNAAQLAFGPPSSNDLVIESGIGVAPAVTERLARLVELDQRFHGNWQQLRVTASSLDQLYGCRELAAAVCTLGNIWSEASSNCREKLLGWGKQAVPLRWVLRDCHAGNALFRHGGEFGNGDLIAWVDFDAVRIDTPAVDLSRIVGSISAEYGANSVCPIAVSRWDQVLAAYRNVRSFTEQEEQLARDLETASALITLGNWVSWIVCEGRSFSESNQQIVRRVEGWRRVVQGLFKDCSSSASRQIPRVDQDFPR